MSQIQMVRWFTDLCNEWMAHTFLKCEECKAVVEREDGPAHIRWHRELKGE